MVLAPGVRRGAQFAGFSGVTRPHKTWRRVLAALLLWLMLGTLAGCWGGIGAALRRPPTEAQTEAYMRKQPEWKRRDWERNKKRNRPSWLINRGAGLNHPQGTLRRHRRLAREFYDLLQAEKQLAVEMERHPQ